MLSHERILVPFSGQRDAVELALSALEQYRPSELVLFFVKNIGFRPSYEPPVATARALARHCREIRRLVVTDARLLQVEGLGALPPRFSRMLGVRTFCTVCQSSLLFLSGAVAAKLEAALIIGPREGLGADLDPIFRSLVTGLPADSPKGRLPTVPIATSQRCRLAAHHAVPDLLEPTAQAELASWLRERGAPAIDYPLEEFELAHGHAPA
jgi:hypothetical protein